MAGRALFIKQAGREAYSGHSLRRWTECTKRRISINHRERFSCGNRRVGFIGIHLIGKAFGSGKDGVLVYISRVNCWILLGGGGEAS